MKKLVLVFTILPLFVFGQDIMTADTLATKTTQGTIDEMLRIVNGEKGKSRNWDAFKNLFLSTTRFTVVTNDADNPFETATTEEMIEFMQDDYYNNGYHEEKLNRIVDQFNGVAQVLEVVRHTEPDGNSTLGLNSYHLIFAENRWWIANIIWTGEMDDATIPEKYFKD